MVINFRSAAEHAWIKENRERCSLKLLFIDFATRHGLPYHFQQKSSDNGIYIHTIHITSYPGLVQSLYQLSIEVVEYIDFPPTFKEIRHEYLSRIVIDWFALEHRMIHTWHSGNFYSDTFALAFVGGIPLHCLSCQCLHIDLVFFSPGIGQPAPSELIDQEGDAFVTITSMGIAAMREKADQCLVQLHTLGNLWAVSRHCTFCTLRRN